MMDSNQSPLKVLKVVTKNLLAGGGLVSNNNSSSNVDDNKSNSSSSSSSQKQTKSTTATNKQQQQPVKSEPTNTKRMIPSQQQHSKDTPPQPPPSSSRNYKYQDIFEENDDDDNNDSDYIVYNKKQPNAASNTPKNMATQIQQQQQQRQDQLLNSSTSTKQPKQSLQQQQQQSQPPPVINVNNNIKTSVYDDYNNSSNNNYNNVNNKSKSSNNNNNHTKNENKDNSKYDGHFKELNFTCDDDDLLEEEDGNRSTYGLEEEFDDFVQIEEKNLNPVCTRWFIPFYQTPEMCKNEVRKWLDERWFLPSNKKDIKWGEQNRFYYPVYVFNVKTSTDFKASFILEEKVESISHTISNSHDEIIVCASTSIDSKLVDALVANHSYSYRLPFYLPSKEEMEPFNSQSLNEKVLSIDISKSEIWKDKVLLFLEQKEKESCKRYVKQKFNVKSINLDMDPPKILQESYTIVYLPISSETYQYGGSFFTCFTSGNRGKTVGTSPIGTGVVGETILGVVSQMTSLVNDSIGM